MDNHKLPNGDTTDSLALYLATWKQLGGIVEALVPGLKLTQFNPDLQFRIGQTNITLPVWFVLRLAENARTSTGKKLHPLKLRPANCEMCKRRIHSTGPGRDRRFCHDCIVLRRKGGIMELPNNGEKA